MKQVFYAHSEALYETRQEARDISDLERLGFYVINPAEKRYQKGYELVGMDYFLRVVSCCHALAFRANPGGSINSEISEEIAHARSLNIPVIEFPHREYMRSLTVEQTESLLKQQGVRNHV